MLALGGQSADAAVLTVTTPVGATAGGLPVSATATLTTLADTVQISLTNTLVNPTSVVQNLSDLGFTLSTGQTAANVTLLAGLGLERTVAANGSFVDGNGVFPGWAVDSTGSPIRLHLLGTATAPAHTIIGPPDGGGTYSNANNSIAGNGPHNPFLAGTVTFALIIPGVTDASAISDVVFSFGTTEGNNVPGVPEPASLTLLGLGMAGMAGYSWRRRKSARVA